MIKLSCPLNSCDDCLYYNIHNVINAEKLPRSFSKNKVLKYMWGALLFINCMMNFFEKYLVRKCKGLEFKFLDFPFRPSKRCYGQLNLRFLAEKDFFSSQVSREQKPRKQIVRMRIQAKG